MRYFTFCFVLLIGPIAVFAEKGNHYSLSGYWYNKMFLESIKVKEKKSALLVLGLEGYQGTRIFRRSANKCFADNAGNLFIIDQCNVLIYIPFHRNRYRKIVFDRIIELPRDRGKSCHLQDNKDDFYTKNEGYTETSEGRDFNYDNSMQKKGSNWPNYANKVTGTWQPDIDGILVTIVETRDGLKAKFSGKTNWVTYIQNATNGYAFTDEHGNKYLFEDNGRAIWIPSDIEKEKIQLKKLSDEPRY